MIEMISAALAAVGLYWAAFRAGRLAFYGEPVDMKPLPSNMLVFKLRVHNSGVLPVQLKHLYLRQEHPRGVLHGDVWALVTLEVDGRSFDLRKAPLAFTGGESRLLSCEFMTMEKTPIGNVGIAFVDLLATEHSVFRDRTRRVLKYIQVSVGREGFRLVFPGSQDYVYHLREEKKQRHLEYLREEKRRRRTTG